jgi:hypothetical protein
MPKLAGELNLTIADGGAILAPPGCRGNLAYSGLFLLSAAGSCGPAGGASFFFLLNSFCCFFLLGFYAWLAGFLDCCFVRGDWRWPEGS